MPNIAGLFEKIKNKLANHQNKNSHSAISEGPAGKNKSDKTPEAATPSSPKRRSFFKARSPKPAAAGATDNVHSSPSQDKRASTFSEAREGEDEGVNAEEAFIKRSDESTGIKTAAGTTAESNASPDKQSEMKPYSLEETVDNVQHKDEPNSKGFTIPHPAKSNYPDDFANLGATISELAGRTNHPPDNIHAHIVLNTPGPVIPEGDVLKRFSDEPVMPNEHLRERTAGLNTDSER